MWIRKLYRTGNSIYVSVPRDIVRAWAPYHVQHVKILWDGATLRITPMRMDELLEHPAQEEEGLPADALSHAKP